MIAASKHRVIGPVSFAIDGKDETAWATDADPGRRNLPHQAVFTLDKPLPRRREAHVHCLAQNHGGWNSDDNQNHNLGRFRLSLTTTADAVADPVPAAVREILRSRATARTAEQQAAVFSYWRTTVPEWADANQRIDELWADISRGHDATRAARRADSRATRTFSSAAIFSSPTDHVDPGVPAFLNPLPPGAPPNRLTLARWLTDRSAPTTARAAVNRMWQSYFGNGWSRRRKISACTASRRRIRKLLDWLAVEFMDQRLEPEADCIG